MTDTKIAAQPRAGEAEQWLALTSLALLEEVYAAYQPNYVDADRRANRRLRFDDRVRVCEANAHGEGTGHWQPARGRDLSLWGISLLSPIRLETDRFLVIEFTLRGCQSQSTLAMLAQVRHVQTDASGQAVLGCKFLEALPPEQGMELVGESV